MRPLELVSQRLSVPESVEAVSRLFYARGWTDGLPIVPPTEQRVRAMLSFTKRSPQEVVAVLPPRWCQATVELIAINAVMAGCLPAYLPVVIAAVEAMAEPPFNLLGVQATTHHCAPLAIVNGPVRKLLSMNGGPNAFGQGNQANATIGRALRLVLSNVAGGTPGRYDMATQGHPGKYTFCVAENEEASPWEPLHVERGFAPGGSTVTVIAAEGPHHVGDQFNKTPDGIIGMIAGTMASPGSSNATHGAGQLAVAICPEHAHTIARGGLSKQDVRAALFERGRVDLAWFSPEDVQHRYQRRQHIGWLPPAGKPEDIVIIVVGGTGKQSSVLPGWGNSYSVTRHIDAAPLGETARAG